VTVQQIPVTSPSALPIPHTMCAWAATATRSWRGATCRQAHSSFAIICHDPDVPSQGDDVNQEDRTVPASLPRVDFFHWLLFDLPAEPAAKSAKASSPAT
jgi:phosphatidylethanolamine-binding protein (PEBP) family uncharacterized protein